MRDHRPDKRPPGNASSTTLRETLLPPSAGWLFWKPSWQSGTIRANRPNRGQNWPKFPRYLEALTGAATIAWLGDPVPTMPGNLSGTHRIEASMAPRCCTEPFSFLRHGSLLASLQGLSCPSSAMHTINHPPSGKQAQIPLRTLSCTRHRKN